MDIIFYIINTVVSILTVVIPFIFDRCIRNTSERLSVLCNKNKSNKSRSIWLFATADVWVTKEIIIPTKSVKVFFLSSTYAYVCSVIVGLGKLFSLLHFYYFQISMLITIYIVLPLFVEYFVGLASKKYAFHDISCSN